MRPIRMDGRAKDVAHTISNNKFPPVKYFYEPMVLSGLVIYG